MYSIGATISYFWVFKEADDHTFKGHDFLLVVACQFVGVLEIKAVLLSLETIFLHYGNFMKRIRKQGANL